MSEQNSTNQMNIDRVNTNNTTVRILLDFYMNMYSHTIRRIDSLYDILDEIRSAINILGGLNDRINNSNTNYSNRYNENREYRSNINQNFRYYSASANENINRNRNNYNGERGNRGGGGRGRNGRGTNSWNRGNFSGGERTHSWQNNENVNTTNTNARDYFDWLNNRVYIQGRPYRIEFERYNIPTNTARNAGGNNDMLNFIQNFYSTVPVIATPAQIQNATRLTRFSDISNPMNSSCPITLEPFSSDANVTEILGCNHLFNPEALTSWLESNVRCPVCRYDIRTNRIASRQQREEQEEETKEETVLEETKEDTPISQSPERPPERNSNSRRISPRQQIDASDNILESTLTEITETLLTQLFNGSTQSNSPGRLFFNNTFDASNNEIIFRGFRI
jgi:hypothetical protein